MLRAWVQHPAPPQTFREQRDGDWVAEPAWHGKAIETRPLYPGSGGLAATPDKGVIRVASPQQAGWTSGAWCGYGMMPDGPLDQNGEAGLMTSFETEAMEEDLALLGFPMFHARVTADVPQANLAAILSIVDDAGRATLVSYGVLNLTHRNSHAEPEPMPAGTAEAVSLQLNACGQHVPKDIG